MGDQLPELFQEKKERDAHSDDQVALILSQHSFDRQKSSHVQSPGFDDYKETRHKGAELNLLGFIKLAASDSKRSEFHTVEEKLLVEYTRPERVRVIPNRQDASQPENAPAPAAIERGGRNQMQQQEGGSDTAQSNVPATTEREVDPRSNLPAKDEEVTARVVGYKKHTVDHVSQSKNPELLGGLFNIDTHTFTDQQSALVRRENEEAFAKRTKVYETGSVNVGPIPVVYIGEKETTNYYESKRTKLDPNSFVRTNMGFLPIEKD